MIWVFIVMLVLANLAAWLAVRKGRLVLAEGVSRTRSRRLQWLAKLT